MKIWADLTELMVDNVSGHSILNNWNRARKLAEKLTAHYKETFFFLIIFNVDKKKFISSKNITPNKRVSSVKWYGFNILKLKYW